MEKSIFGITELGQKIANPDAMADQMAQFTDCSVNGQLPAMDALTVTTSANVTAFTFNGVAVTLGTPIAASSVAALKTALLAEIEKYEHNPGLVVEYAGGDLTVEHIGQLTLSSLTLSVGGAQAFTRKTTLASVCQYKLEGAVDTISDIEFNGNAETLANEPYAYTGTPATDATTAGTLATDIATALTALSITATDIVVTVNNDLEGFDISFKSQKLNAPIRAAGAGTIFLEGSCIQRFV